jgi:hypothetical protein
MPDAWQVIQARVGAKVVVAGHSLGAARAAVLCGLMRADGCKALARCVFGEPLPGMSVLAALISDIPGRSYCNGDAHHHDVVTDVPFILPLLKWVRASPLIHVTAEPNQTAVDLLGELFSFHHAPLYRQAMKALVPAGAAA